MRKRCPPKSAEPQIIIYYIIALIQSSLNLLISKVAIKQIKMIDKQKIRSLLMEDSFFLTLILVVQAFWSIDGRSIGDPLNSKRSK